MITTTTLKNAARAIGYDLWSDPDGSHYLVDYDGVKLKRWDPGTSGSDSFELMVALRLCVDTYAGMITDRHDQVYEFVFEGEQSVRQAILNVAGWTGAAL